MEKTIYLTFDQLIEKYPELDIIFSEKLLIIFFDNNFLEDFVKPKRENDVCLFDEQSVLKLAELHMSKKF